MYVFIGNVQKKRERFTGVSPPPFRLPPHAITPQQVLHHNRDKRRGGRGGQAQSPPSSNVYVIVHSIAKAILQSHSLLRLFTPCTPHQYRENPVEHYSFQVYMQVDRSFILFLFWVLPEHDYQGDERYHHNRTRRQEQVDCRWLIHLLQCRSILLGLPASDGNVGCSIRILLQC